MAYVFAADRASIPEIKHGAIETIDGRSIAAIWISALIGMNRYHATNEGISS
jgi:hypothetical protein